jgi:hypothetical protein
MLRRGTKFTPGEVFDTYLAARLVGLKEVGLASLVKEFFGIELPKSSQKANWARRPLTQTMIEYAINDTLYLIELANGYLRSYIPGPMGMVSGSCQRRSWLPVRIERKIRSEFGRFQEATRFREGLSQYCGYFGTGGMPKRRMRIAPASRLYGTRSLSRSRNWPKRVVSAFRRGSRVQGESGYIPSCNRRWNYPNRNGLSAFRRFEFGRPANRISVWSS